MSGIQSKSSRHAEAENLMHKENNNQSIDTNLELTLMLESANKNIESDCNYIPLYIVCYNS